MNENIKFEHSDFPILYRLSDESSLNGQRKYLKFFKLEQITLISGAIVSMFPLENPSYGYIFATLSAFFFALSIALAVGIKSMKYENHWYIGRAIAESIKTLTWRYITRGEPFVDDASQEIVDGKFCSILATMLKENGGDIDLIPLQQNFELQITEKMRVLRNSEFNQRKELYVENRVKDQLNWYQKKAKFNKDKGNTYFVILVFCQSIAMIYSLVLIKFPDLFNGVPLITSIAASVIAWTQVKQFEEFAQAYSTTAQEISLILTQLPYVTDENKFSVFVGDTENAFSREHTLWLARKDVYNYSSK
jgi:hypothetical protein